MIPTIEATREDVPKVLQWLVSDLEEPLYRGLGEQAEEEYKQTKRLAPKNGSLSVGKGVFFTNNAGYAVNFAKNTLLVTSKRILDPEDRAVDTRKRGYDAQFRIMLNNELGIGNYDGYVLWDEICKHDTIIREGGADDEYIFTRRRPVQEEEIIAEVRLLN